MRIPAKVFIVTLVSSVTFAFGAVPAQATPPSEEFGFAAATPRAISAASVATSADAAPTTTSPVTQSLSTSSSIAADNTLDLMLADTSAATIPHNFDVDATIALALSEVGTSRATGWSQPGECIMSAQRWIKAGGGNWPGGGTPVTNYNNAIRLTMADAQPGDVIQYEHLTFPDSYVSGVHTVLIIGVNGDGTFDIVESNNPGGSGLVSRNKTWTPAPPAGFQAVAWRF